MGVWCQTRINFCYCSKCLKHYCLHQKWSKVTQKQSSCFVDSKSLRHFVQKQSQRSQKKALETIFIFSKGCQREKKKGRLKPGGIGMTVLIESRREMFTIKASKECSVCCHAKKYLLNFRAVVCHFPVPLLTKYVLIFQTLLIRPTCRKTCLDGLEVLEST